MGGICEHGSMNVSAKILCVLLPAAGIAAGCSSPWAIKIPTTDGFGLVRGDLSAAAREIPGASGRSRLVRTPDGQSVSVAEAADELAVADVVFLGELHDNPEGHAVQLALTKAIAERRGKMILSMEMFERDAQRRLDLYLRGIVTEAHFLEAARPWSNYADHYRPAVEFARAQGFPVIAANVYRPIASRVARLGLFAGIGDPWAARTVDTSPGEYRRRFEEVMTGDHPVPESTMDRVFAAQCIKDDTMAESIARALEAASPSDGEALPIVVHWNGRFHSDYGLGTVERLRARMPHLNIAVVSMIVSGNLDHELRGDEPDQGHFVALVPPPSPPKRPRK